MPLQSRTEGMKVFNSSHKDSFSAADSLEQELDHGEVDNSSENHKADQDCLLSYYRHHYFRSRTTTA